MNAFVESIKRLYIQNLISKEKVDSFLKLRKITEEEHLYILGKDGEE